MISIPFPNHYSNHSLYFVGYLDSDNILKDIEKVLPQVTKILTDSFSKIGGDKKMVVMNLLQEVNGNRDHDRSI